MWPIQYVELKLIDEFLQCGICYEYMDTSVMTLCSHNYCSLCIRKYLHYKTQCPICLEETFEKDLRKNKILDEIISQYLNVKEKLLKKFHLEETLKVKDKNFEEKETGNVCSLNNSEYKKKQDVFDTSKILHKSSDSPVHKNSNITPHGKKDYQDVSTPSTSTERRIPLMFTPKSTKGFPNDENCQIVTCPVCKVDVSQNNINKHLDQCLKRENAKDQPKKSESKRKPLPKLVLNLMKDNAIKKKLKELGLSSQGDRKVLESRLQRYIILYNAECDKINPRPISELIRQFEEEENLEKKVQKPSNRLNVNRNTEQNVIEQQRKKYLAVNKDSFDHLIAKIKHADSPQKLSIRRKIFSKENPDDSHESHITENDSTIRDNEKSNFLSPNSANPYIEDSDSNATCPLQIYSSTDPMKFLTVELASSSNDSTEQSAFIQETPKRRRKTNPVSFNFIVKTEESLENTLIHEKIISSNSRECNFSEDRMDTDTIESVSKYTRIELENRERQVNSSAENSRSGLKYSPEKYIGDSESRDSSQRELCNKDTDSIVQDIESFVGDNESAEDDHNLVVTERLKQEQLHDAKKEYVSDCTKFEKENVESLDETIKVFRKREREVTFISSDEEKAEEKSMNTRKSLRLGLTEAKGFNNGNIYEKTRNEENSQSKKKQTRGTCAKSTRNCTKKSVRLRNKMS
ncbi:E3 ubiquitin-protein ligase RAD18-like isoform X1 [Linepithema humile]|uniref:E3 ubiquitin-protein ligase RAD18-like isoform X1 n=1 Tax=Linepithema humile TaxID=83485 RepID=UPI00351ED6A8